MKENTITTNFAKQLAEALRPGLAPEDLRRTLRQAARSQDARRTWHALGIAATLMLLLGTSAWGWMAHRSSHEGERFSKVALQTFLQDQRLDFTVDDSDRDSVEQCMERCRRWSEKSVGFFAHLPKNLAGQPLKGGCACSIASSRVACYYFKDGRAVYVFERPLRGLGSNSISRPTALVANHSAFAWNEEGRGYILVEPPKV